ncbi:hypothetical protein DACRYDRAFT_99902 [Dacryopinax primogenitus]|uniref:Uncharacterized protein n=1 Tax=Dacryopinax primogenitus (strain DJM 731) TaxID=1858805 RepID=M5G1U9_DACPD|nr:uncharacterized protein DACRYDRAFT_99902 [Dacryopinax primogenitus]EJU02185.1 hypothetical protein DACRYDRAFT_99902 [Dacryopinax primogenitus]
MSLPRSLGRCFSSSARCLLPPQNGQNAPFHLPPALTASLPSADGHSALPKPFPELPSDHQIRPRQTNPELSPLSARSARTISTASSADAAYILSLSQLSAAVARRSRALDLPQAKTGPWDLPSENQLELARRLLKKGVPVGGLRVDMSKTQLGNWIAEAKKHVPPVHRSKSVHLTEPELVEAYTNLGFSFPDEYEKLIPQERGHWVRRARDLLGMPLNPIQKGQRATRRGLALAHDLSRALSLPLPFSPSNATRAEVSEYITSARLLAHAKDIPVLRQIKQKNEDLEATGHLRRLAESLGINSKGKKAKEVHGEVEAKLKSGMQRRREETESEKKGMGELAAFVRSFEERGPEEEERADEALTN